MPLLESIWGTTIEIAPYLLVGFLIAGLLHVVVPEGWIGRFLSGRSRWAVVKAALVGMPMPLCSCSVLPVAEHLRRDGAGKGATATFLATTPATGVDSIMATWGMLGPLFSVIRLAHTFLSGVVLGWMVDATNPEGKGGSTAPAVDHSTPESCHVPSSSGGGWGKRAREVFEHGFGDILFSLRKWLVVGIVLGGVLAWASPRLGLGPWLGNPWIAYPLMLLAAGPLYVCATGSIPIAASLVAAGMSPGAALVFLSVGPATNTTTMAFLGAKLGRRTLLVYLAVMVVASLLVGGAVDLAGARWNVRAALPCHAEWSWWSHLWAGLLVILLFRDQLRLPRPTSKGVPLKFVVPSMSCGNCVRHITRALEGIPGASGVQVDLGSKTAQCAGVSADQVLAALEREGYPAQPVG